MTSRRDQTTRQARPYLYFAAIFLAAVLLALLAHDSAPAQSLQGKVDDKKQKLEQAEAEKGVLSTEISKLNGKIDQLTGEVATLRNREAIVEAELNEAEESLDAEQEVLGIARERLGRITETLAERLIAIYKADTPDSLSVVLDSDGFDDVVDRYEYLGRIEQQDASIVDRTRELRDDTRNAVEQIRVTRDTIAAKQRELERTRVALEAREAELAAAKDRSQRSLTNVKGNIQRLEGDIGDLEDQIQAQLAAAAAESTPSAPSTIPAGPIQGGSGGYIWPVSGPVVSPFGPRWGRLHAGIDIAAPAGTPIRAIADGTIALAAPTSGYGNYTCINHGGGLSSCYAHLSSYAITSGSVSQGDVIGNVGCTGHCFGDHLHFEIRVNGVPTDPMAYL